MSTDRRASDLWQELKVLLNRHSQENESGTPDFILADYLMRCLETYNVAIRQRENWHGRPVSTNATVSKD